MPRCETCKKANSMGNGGLLCNCNKGGNMSKRKIILLNGAAGTGKDAIAKYIEEQNPLTKQHSFKHALIKIAASIADIDIHQWENRYCVREFKEKPWDQLPTMRYMGNHFSSKCGFDYDPDSHMSMREFLAFVSEIVVKPTLGLDFFGRAAIKHCDDHPMPVYVFSDSGFEAEAKVFVDSGNYDVYVVKLHRGDLTFDGDSRDYLPIDSGYKEQFSAWNNTTVAEVSNEILRKSGVYVF